MRWRGREPTGFSFSRNCSPSDKIVTLASASSPYPRFDDVRSVRIRRHARRSRGFGGEAERGSSRATMATSSRASLAPDRSIPARAALRLRAVGAHGFRRRGGPGEIYDTRPRGEARADEEAEAAGGGTAGDDPRRVRPSLKRREAARRMDEHSKEDRDFALKRLAFLVACGFLALVLGISAMLNPSILHPLARTTLVIGSLAERLLVGGSGKDYSLEATVCLAAVLALRLSAEPVGRRCTAGGRGSAPEILAGLAHALAHPRCTARGGRARGHRRGAVLRGYRAEGGDRRRRDRELRRGEGRPGAMVLAFSRVLLSWQERLAENSG